jgi:hypothetical protein
VWNFTTKDVIDPTVNNFTPTDNATDVGINANLVVVFSEPVDTVTGNIYIRKLSDNTIFETIDVTDASKVSGSGTDTITIDPDGTFAGETGYYVQIEADAFDDLAGNSFAGFSDTATWNFTTEDIAAPTVTTLTPADGATGVGVNDNLVITFNEDVTAVSGNIYIRKTSDSTVYETIDVTNGSLVSITDATVTINPDSTFASETSYFIQIDSTAFDDLSGNGYAGIYDSTTWHFTTGDVEAPYVLSFVPDDETTNVGVDDTLVIVFSEPVYVQSGSITIRKSSDSSVFEVIGLPNAKVTGDSTDTITINPGNTFAGETRYFVQISSDAFDDASSNDYAGIADSTTWNFTTGDVTEPTVSTLGSHSQHPDACRRRHRRGSRRQPGDHLQREGGHGVG